MVLSKRTDAKAPSWVAALIVAVAAPVTGAAVSYGQLQAQQERNEFELMGASTKQKHDFRMAYFEKAISGPQEQREAVLRWLANSYEDPPLQAWAQEELVRMVGLIDEGCARARGRCLHACTSEYPDWGDLYGRKIDVTNKAKRKLRDCVSSCREEFWTCQGDDAEFR